MTMAYQHTDLKAVIVPMPSRQRAVFLLLLFNPARTSTHGLAFSVPNTFGVLKEWLN